jgi:hypothetical protein
MAATNLRTEMHPTLNRHLSTCARRNFAGEAKLKLKMEFVRFAIKRHVTGDARSKTLEVI